MNTAPQVKTTSLVDAINNLEFETNRGAATQETEINNIPIDSLENTNREIDRINMCSLLRRISKINDANINTLASAIDNAHPGAPSVTTKLTDIATTELDFCHNMLNSNSLKIANTELVNPPSTDIERNNYVSIDNSVIGSISHSLNNIETEPYAQNKLILIDKIIKKYHSISNQPDSAQKKAQLTKIQIVINAAISKLGDSRKKFDQNIVIKQQTALITPDQKRTRTDQIKKTNDCITRIKSLTPAQLLAVANLPLGFSSTDDNRIKANSIFDEVGGDNRVEINTNNCISKKDEQTLIKLAKEKLENKNKDEINSIAKELFETLPLLSLTKDTPDTTINPRDCWLQLNSTAGLPPIIAPDTQIDATKKYYKEQITKYNESIKIVRNSLKMESEKTVLNPELITRFKKQITAMENRLEAFTNSYYLCKQIIEKPNKTVEDLRQLQLEISNNINLASIKERKKLDTTTKTLKSETPKVLINEKTMLDFGFRLIDQKSKMTEPNVVVQIGEQNNTQITTKVLKNDTVTITPLANGGSECKYETKPSDETLEQTALAQAHLCWSSYNIGSSESIHIYGSDIAQQERIIAALYMTLPEGVDASVIKIPSILQSPERYSGVMDFNTTGMAKYGGYVAAKLPLTYKKKSVTEFKTYMDNLKIQINAERQSSIEMFGKANPTITEELDGSTFKKTM